MRGKWVCDQCDTLTQQAMPAYVIDKGIASPELLSHVLVSKYADHLPLYRQCLIYQRAGIELSRSTLSDWIGRCGVELEPLANALKEVVLQQQVLHADCLHNPRCVNALVVNVERQEGHSVESIMLCMESLLGTVVACIQW